MEDIYQIMRSKKIILPQPPARGGVYTSAQEFGGKFIYCSGCGPALNGEEPIVGRLGQNLSLEAGRRAAYNCMLNLLANLDAKLGDLNRIRRFVKILAFVNSANDFTQQPQVINSGSQLLVELFGEEAGCPARTAVGTNALPGGIAVEIEALVEIK